MRICVLRGGAGLFFDTGNSQGSQGYSGIGTSGYKDFAGSSFPLSSAALQSVPSPSIAAPYDAALYGFDPDLKLPYSILWNAALEQQLGRQQSLTVNYVAALADRLLVQRIVHPEQFGNAAFAQGNGLYLTRNAASSSYHSLQVKLQRNLSHGLQVLATYTWAHGIDDTSSNFLLYALKRSSSDNDIRNNIQLAFTYDLPQVQKHTFGGVALNHWSVDGRVTSRSALHVDIQGDLGIDAGTGASTYFSSKHCDRPTTLLKGFDCARWAKDQLQLV